MKSVLLYLNPREAQTIADVMMWYCERLLQQGFQLSFCKDHLIIAQAMHRPKVARLYELSVRQLSLYAIALGVALAQPLPMRERVHLRRLQLLALAPLKQHCSTFPFCKYFKLP